MIFVCLGNPGKKYQKTRHNVGRMFGDWVVKNKLDSKIGVVVLDGFMNQSGEYLQKIIKNTNWQPQDLIVVHDDLDLAFGDFKIQFGRGAAGHHGVESIIEALGTDQFWRVRIGIGRPPAEIDPEKFVLMPFSSQELATLPVWFQKIFDQLGDRLDQK